MKDFPIKEVLQSQSDPGSITPRGDNYEESMEKWQARALGIVLERHGMKDGLVENSFIHDGHPLANDWTGTNMAFDLLEKHIEEHHNVLRCYPGFLASYPKWQEEMGQVRRIRQRVQKLVWDEAHRKHDGPKDETA